MCLRGLPLKYQLGSRCPRQFIAEKVDNIIRECNRVRLPHPVRDGGGLQADWWQSSHVFITGQGEFRVI